MKAGEDDEAFWGAGAKPGLEIWCVDNRRLVFVPKSSHGKFFSGSSYIVLNTLQSRSGLLQHDVHYWVGKDFKEIDAAMVSDKALELDAALGSRTVQYREDQGKGIFNITQDDLTTEDVFILDCCNEIFVWDGKHADLQSKQQYLALGKKFLEADILQEGLSPEAAIYIISEGNEPTFFTCFFDWDPSKGNMHGNSFERKLALLNRSSPTVKGSLSSRRYSSEYAPAHAQEYLRSGRPQMRSGSPVSSFSSSSEPVKPRHFTPIARKLSSRTHTDDSSEDSPVKGGEHNIMENVEILSIEDEERTEIDLLALKSTHMNF